MTMTEAASGAAGESRGTTVARPTPEMRRETIAEAARVVFTLNGKAAKTRDIARAAGVTEAVLYRHFRSKDEIFEAAVLTPLETLVGELMARTVQFASASPQRRFELSQEFQRSVLTVVEEIAPLMGAALLSGDGKRFYAQRLMPMVEHAADATNQAMSPRQRRSLAPRTMFMMLAGMYLGVCLDVMLGDPDDTVDFDRDLISRQLTDLIVFGLFGPDGEQRLRQTSH